MGGFIGSAVELVAGGIRGSEITSRAADKEAELGAAEREEIWRVSAAKRKAVEALLRGSKEESQYRQKSSAAIQRAQMQYAASGVDSTVGTPAAVSASMRELQAQDAATIRDNAMREAWGHRQEVENARYRINMLKGKKKRLEEETVLAQIGNFVGTAGSVYEKSGAGSGGGGGGGMDASAFASMFGGKK